ncbi:MAG: hypothetical protein AAF330_04960, partial [Pseudomonadota bacterium]
QILATATRAHSDAGLAVWSPPLMRAMGRFLHVPRFLTDTGEPVDELSGRRLWVVQSDVAARMNLLERAGARTLIVTEENLLGSMNQNFREGVHYPDVAHRLRSFLRVFGHKPRRIALGIRDYGQAWTSGYGYTMTRKPDLPPVRQVAEALATQARGWCHVVADIQDACPESEILVWRQEDLTGNETTIASAISGRDDIPFKPPVLKHNSSLERGSAVHLFDKGEIEALSKRYAEDVALLLEPDPQIRWAVDPPRDPYL